MTYLPYIQNHLKEQLSELCEACFAEHEWLEEGRNFDANDAKHNPAALNGNSPAAEAANPAD